MVQGNSKLSHADTLRGKKHKKGTAATLRRAAPKEPGHIDPHAHKTTAAIKKRIETLMAGRLSHEGGTLVIVPRPTAVDSYDKARPRTGLQQNRNIFAASMARRARMKQSGVNLPELGAHAGEDEPSEQKGKKRKRGMHGIYKHGDDWFNEEDAALEAIKYESDDSDLDDDDDTPAAPQQPPTKEDALNESTAESMNDDGELDEDADSDEGDFDLADFEECSDDEDDDEDEEEDESAVETSVSKQSNKSSNKPSNKQTNKQSNKPVTKPATKPAQSSKPIVAAKPVSKAVIGTIKKDASHAAKRGKSLLGGWFGKKK